MSLQVKNFIKKGLLAVSTVGLLSAGIGAAEMVMAASGSDRADICEALTAAGTSFETECKADADIDDLVALFDNAQAGLAVEAAKYYGTDDDYATFVADINNVDFFKAVGFIMTKVGFTTPDADWQNFMQDKNNAIAILSTDAYTNGDWVQGNFGSVIAYKDFYAQVKNSPNIETIKDNMNTHAGFLTDYLKAVGLSKFNDMLAKGNVDEYITGIDEIMGACEDAQCANAVWGAITDVGSGIPSLDEIKAALPQTPVVPQEPKDEEPSATESATVNHNNDGGNHAPGLSEARPQTCADGIPGGVADLFQIDRQGASATLYFSPVNDNVKQYHVVFGHQEGQELFGQLSAEVTQDSNNGVQKVVINNLNPQQVYAFQVMPVNGCAVGQRSNWLSTHKTGISYRYN